MLSAHSILLVRELQGSIFDVSECRVIQRSCGGAAGPAADGEVDVLELEGLGSGFWCGGVGVFSGSEEPEEGDDDEVNDVCIGGAVVGMSGVKDVPELAQDGGVDRVGAAWGIIVIGESFEESRV